MVVKKWMALYLSELISYTQTEGVRVPRVFAIWWKWRVNLLLAMLMLLINTDVYTMW